MKFLKDIAKALISPPTQNGAENELFNVQPFVAPELVDTGEWFNSSPLSLSMLKGQVVLLEFWTFGCINCVRTLPYVQSWYEEFKDQGFVVLGVHTPEFEAEKVTANVERAVGERGLSYPVVQDNNMSTWRTYSNRYWPAQYLIDKQGNVRRVHFGEGQYDETRQAIQQLINEE